jgi:DNA repair exonuclease SbcCD ATPase subunit
MTTAQLEKIINAKETELQLAIERQKQIKYSLEQEKEELLDYEKIKSLVVELGNKTQQDIFTYIEETVTLALHSVFGNDFNFKIVSETKRDQQEVSFFIEHKGNLLEPKNNTMSGGVIDICSLALRVIAWSLENPQSSPIFFLDEPLKNPSKGFRPQVSQFIKELADLLNIQIIFVTHVDEFISNTDNVFYL